MALFIDLSFVHLLQVGCEAVPHRATIYAQLVESELLWSWTQIRPVQVDGRKLLPPASVGQCAGAPSVCDIQLSQVPPSAFTPIGPLCSMFRWELRNKPDLSLLPLFNSPSLTLTPLITLL